MLPPFAPIVTHPTGNIQKNTPLTARGMWPATREIHAPPSFLYRGSSRAIPDIYDHFSIRQRLLVDAPPLA